MAIPLMRKKIIIATTVSVVLVVLLYNLPKVVVQQTEATDKGKANNLASSKPTNETAVQHEIGENLNDSVQFYQKSIAKVKGTSSELEAMNRLLAFYKANNMYDSASVLAVSLAKEFPGKNSFLKAGDTFSDLLALSLKKESAQSNADKARFYFEKVLELDPNDNTVKAKIAMTYISTDKPMEGILMLREVAEKEPNNEFAQYNLGIFSFQTGQYGKAAKRFEEVVRINPVSVNGYYYLGLSQVKLNLKKEAATSFQKALKLETDPETKETIEMQLKELLNQ